jgi:hypothetical protein
LYVYVVAFCSVVTFVVERLFVVPFAFAVYVRLPRLRYSLFRTLLRCSPLFVVRSLLDLFCALDVDYPFDLFVCCCLRLVLRVTFVWFRSFVLRCYV